MPGLRSGVAAIVVRVVPEAGPARLDDTMWEPGLTRGEPKEQRIALAGHKPQDTTARNHEHLTPDYLQAAVLEIDACRPRPKQPDRQFTAVLDI